MTASSEALERWFDTALPDRLDDLDKARRGRLWLLAGIAVAALTAVVGLGAVFAFAVLQTEAAAGVFWTVVGLAAGPAILVVVLAWATGVRSHLEDRLARDVVVPALREMFGEFRYQSTRGPADWKPFELFPEDFEERGGSHRIEVPLEEEVVRLGWMSASPPGGLRDLLFGSAADRRFHGIFATIEPADVPEGTSLWSRPDDPDGPLAESVRRAADEAGGPLESEVEDVEGLHVVTDQLSSARALPVEGLRQLVERLDGPDGAVAVAVRDGAMAIAVPAAGLDVRTDPRRPVVDADRIRRFFGIVEGIVEIRRES